MNRVTLNEVDKLDFLLYYACSVMIPRISSLRIWPSESKTVVKLYSRGYDDSNSLGHRLVHSCA